MPKKATRQARLNFRLPPELKDVIEAAAAHRGQSVTEFAISTLVQSARGVIQEHDVTVLSNRDRDVFLALLDDVDAKPNSALSKAAARYKKQVAKSFKQLMAGVTAENIHAEVPTGPAVRRKS